MSIKQAKRKHFLENIAVSALVILTWASATFAFGFAMGVAKALILGV